MMRVLLVAPFTKPWYTSYYIMNALKQMGGITVQGFDYRFVASNYGIERMNHFLSLFIKEFKPDLILSLKAELVHPKVIKNQWAPTVLWFFDYENPVPSWLLELAKAHDFFFSVCKGYLKEFPKEVNAHFLPEAYDDTIIKPINVSEEDRRKYGSDLSFLGTDKPRPCEVLRKVVENGFDLKIWGNQTDNGWRKATIEKYWMGYRSSDEELNKTCASSKIVLGVSDWQKRECTLCFSARVYQVLGAGGFLLEERNKGIEEMFKDRVDLALWDDEDDLMAKIRYYLSHKNERGQISKRGHENVKRKHTFKVRVKQLLRMVGLWK